MRNDSVIALESRTRSCTFEGRPARITALLDLTQRKEREQEIDAWKRRYELAEGEHRRSEREMRALLDKRLQEQERLAAIGGIAASIAHEIKNPLFAISSGIQLLLEELVLDDEQRMTFDVIFQDVMRMDRLVRQLQLLSARPRLDRSVQPVTNLIRAAITLNRGLLTEKSLRVSDSIAPNLPDLVVDRDQLLQILFNLIQNAISVSPQGGRIEATAEAGRDRASVIIKVRDEGPGIPDDLEERIFEPFFTTKTSSAGMGLAISRRIALDHDGSLAGENHPLGGAVFVLELPVKTDG